MTTEFSVEDRNKPFAVNKDELATLMKMRNEELKILLERYHETVEELCFKLRSDPTKGVSEDNADLSSRKYLFGTNSMPSKKNKSFFRLLWQAVKEPILVMLVVAAAVSFAVALWNIFRQGSGERKEYGWIRSVAILTAVIINAIVAAGNNYRKERQHRNLQSLVEKRYMVTVIRNGRLKQISAEELVVGDICTLKDGDIVQADGLLLRSDDLTVDESVLTGESDPIRKHPDGDIRMLSGTAVMEGTGKFLVIAVGLSSHAGEMHKLTVDLPEEQPKIHRPIRVVFKRSKLGKKKSVCFDLVNLEKQAGSSTNIPAIQQPMLQEKITRISMRIAKYGLIFSFLVAIILIIRFCVEQYVTKKQEWVTGDMASIMDSVIIGITLLVVIIPAGLPLAVSLTLAVSAKKMMKDNNLVRHLSACETMGYATSICSDKTGTLTSNKMVVSQVYIGGQTYLGKPPRNFIAPKTRELIADGISVNSSYSSNIDVIKELGPVLHTGNRTECALLAFVNDIGVDYKEIRRQHPEDSFVKVYSFNPCRKTMSTVIKTESGWRIFCKGAAEVVLEKCSHVKNEEGETEELTAADKEQILKKVVNKMSSTGLRTLCLAYKDVEATKDKPNFAESVVKGLTMLAIFGIEDPVRPEVPRAIQQCRRAGITVRMITGDNVNTAVQVATKCGIISPNGDLKDIVLDSKEFNKRIRGDKGEVVQELFDKVWPSLRVLARATPHDKFLLVDGMIKSNRNGEREVVAVTGDGTNDAPALRRADVGFAMGIDGTEVAKEASDIILTDDNFTSIVKACMWGRGIFDNICKFLQFQLTVNLVVLTVSLVGASASGAAPLEAVPMLWINVIQDTMASLALASEPPSEKLLERRPYPRKMNILSKIMIRNIVSQGIYQITICFLIIFGSRNVLNFLWNSAEAQTTKEIATLTFNSVVMMTTFNLINSRCILNERNVFRGILRNRIFILMIVVMIGIQAIVVEYGGPAFVTEALNWRKWVFCIIVGIGSLLWYQVTLCIMPAK